MNLGNTGRLLTLLSSALAALTSSENVMTHTLGHLRDAFIEAIDAFIGWSWEDPVPMVMVDSRP